MADARARITIKGRVQGVGYRYFAEEKARKQELRGYVMNLPDGNVETVVEGGKSNIEEYVNELKTGPPMSRVTDVNIVWEPYQGSFTDFGVEF